MASKHKTFRFEIQGLRAVAVLAVLLYHLWPASLPGGYVGVDVFFVISGFLITGVLLREAMETGTIRLSTFYQRRIKRLLPAATVTLIGTALAHTLLPVVSWANTAKATIASTLYVQNWWLASRATNYLAQEDAPGPLQHFWSLSVEEQYYIVWPLVMLLALLAAKKIGGSARGVLRTSLVLIGAVSLAYSIYLSRTDIQLAYFATTTRAWELALGGFLAFLPKVVMTSDRNARLLATVGMGMIITSCFVFNSQTLFPGYAALLPTLGTAAVLVAGSSSSSWSIYYLLKNRAFQYYGDISYSLYLWHWPVIVFYKQLRGAELSLVDGLIIFTASSALAHLTKRFVEDIFRKPGRFDRHRWQTFVFASLCMCSSLVAGWYVLHSFNKFMEPSTENFADFGSVADDYELPEGARLRAALRARDDVSAAYKSGCISTQKSTSPSACVSGSEDSSFHLALIGDSHAVHWEPAFTRLAEENSWKLSLYAKSACSLADLSVGIGIPKVLYEACDRYRSNLLLALEEVNPDLVVITQSRSYDAFHIARKLSKQALAEGLLRTVNRLEEAGIPVVLMFDGPKMNENIPECLSSPNFKAGACDTQVQSAIGGTIDPAVLAGAQSRSLKRISMTQHFCDQRKCPAVIGGVVVYRDKHHLTATFVVSLTGDLGRALSPHMAQEPIPR